MSHTGEDSPPTENRAIDSAAPERVESQPTDSELELADTGSPEPDSPASESAAEMSPDILTKEPVPPDGEMISSMEKLADPLPPRPIDSEADGSAAFDESEAAVSPAAEDIPAGIQPAPDPTPEKPEPGSSLPDSEDGASPEGAEEAVDTRHGSLEEWVEPIELPAVAPPLEPGVILTDEAGRSYRVTAILETRGDLRFHEGADDDGSPVRIVEGASESAATRLRREAEILAGVNSRMFPALRAVFEQDARTVLVTDPFVVEGRFADLLEEEDPSLPETIRVLAQVAHALAQLHRSGWVHMGLRPSVIGLGKPVRLLDFTFATRIGETPVSPFYHAGYSPPESMEQTPADPRSDVYAVGALLYHAVNGRPIGEVGAEISSWSPPSPAAGVPQILRRCLGALEERYSSMEDLHRDLLRLSRRTTPPVRYETAQATTIGLEPTRTANEDACGLMVGQINRDGGAISWAVLCVADGMGGMAAGEAASTAAIEAALERATRTFRGAPRLSVEEQVRETREWMIEANEAAVRSMEAVKARGGCTLVCACLIDRRLTISHVGDCRLYLLRDGNTTLLTRDHSYVMALAMQGEIELSEIRTHPDRSKITRSLGDRAPLPGYAIDSLEQATGKLSLELSSGDILLACSDGLWEPVVEEEMAAILQERGNDLTGAADDLLRLALERGAPDNATVSLLKVMS